MTVLKEGTAMATMGWTMGVMTIVFLSAMIGWTVWTWLPSRRLELEAMSRLPLEED